MGCKMGVTKLKNVINQQLSYCTFQKHILLLCCDICVKRYTLMKGMSKMIKSLLKFNVTRTSFRWQLSHVGQGGREAAQLPNCQVYETEHARSNTILGLWQWITLIWAIINSDMSDICLISADMSDIYLISADIFPISDISEI
mgnify:CR=1 FL=1